MPRGARLDAPGTLHHVMVRAIEKRNIADDETDREDFICRLGKLSEETETAIYAWALMPNHAHILLRTGLTDTMGRLNRYKWCGHAAILGIRANNWQDQEYVLKWFGSAQGPARKAYLQFVKQGVNQGRRPDLVGGGLIRSLGGWSAVKSLRKFGLFEKGDERILGSGDFVENVVKQADENIKHQLPAKDLKKEAAAIISRECKRRKINIEVIRSGSRLKEVSKLRTFLALKLVNDFGLSLAESARQLGVSTSAIAQILRRQN